MCRFLLGLAFLAALLPTEGFGQVRSGRVELNFAGSLDAMTAGRSLRTYWSGSLNTAAGYFIFRRLEAGIDFSLAASQGYPGYGAYGGFATAHFPSAPEAVVVPYLGVRAGSTFNGPTKVVDAPTIYGVYGGVKAFLSPGAAVSIQPYFSRETWDDYYDIKKFGVMTGLSIFLR